jgi:hypothetical protein
MPRYGWRDRDEDRRGYRADDDDRGGYRAERDLEDFGQADYSRDYDYDPDTRSGYRTDRLRPRDDDYGQADYSDDWAYDRDRGPYRRHADDRAAEERARDERRRTERPGERREPRSWLDRAGDFLTGRDDGRSRRRGPSDRVIWAVIVERLEDERLDLRDVEVLVDEAEVTLNGTVRSKADKRRIEDIADLEAVRHVQNNLRVRDRGHWTFL